jgi:lantibiotic biosynthesis protein
MASSGQAAFLTTAQTIGERICRTAFWSGSRCNWIGRSIVNPASPDIPTNKALSPDVYEGTSGIAFFLANLHFYKKLEEYQRTAEGAIRQALSRLDDVPTSARFGFYSGKIGIAYVAAKLSTLLDSKPMLESSIEIVRGLTMDHDQREGEEGHLMDIISGNAGAIPALLELYEMSKEEAMLKLASQLGDELVSAVVRGEHGVSWDSRANGVQSSIHNLTGFAHGTAGVGYALLELFHKTDKRQFLTVAEEAFQYENSWFSEKYDNWPDFRAEGGNANLYGDAREFSYSTAWCHGAPGIGLSRLRAYQLLGDEKYLRDTQASLRVVTRIAKAKNSVDQPGNFSLCHGLSGIGELLLYASDVLNDSSYRSMAEEVGKYGIENYESYGLPWPCGIRTGETPGLMLGLAGIGIFYLHLHKSSKTASPLIIVPTE